MDKRIDSIRLFTASAALLCIAIPFIPAATRASAAVQADGYCIQRVGDLNGDGVQDFAVSERPPLQEAKEIVYLILGGEEALPETLDRASLKERADYILRGPFAAPFLCPAAPAPSSAPATGAGKAIKVPVKPASQRASPVGNPVYYKIAVDFNTLSPGRDSLASGINGRGQVVGRFLTAEGLEHACFFDGSGLRDLGTLGGHFSDATGINADSMIVGYSLTGETDETGFVASAFVSDGLALRSLGIPWSHASGINDQGQIVGDMKIASGRFHAFLHENGRAVDLGTLGGAESFAHSVNGSGQVVGESATFIPGTAFRSVRGFLYENGTLHDLGSMGYACFALYEGGAKKCFEFSSATDINNEGQIAGFSTTSTNRTRAFLMSGGAFEDLGTLGGSQAWAYAVNDSGQVVGTSLTEGDAGYRPFLYDLETLYDLRELVVNRTDGFSMWGAYDINNFGQIVGVNYLLDPVYERIAPGRDFSFSDTLGRVLTFEYWVLAGSRLGCEEGGRGKRVEFRIESEDLAGPDRVALAGELDRWRPVDDFVLECADSKDWRTATVSLPLQLEGKVVSVSFRVGGSGGFHPTVYLRHFR